MKRASGLSAFLDGACAAAFACCLSSASQAQDRVVPAFDQPVASSHRLHQRRVDGQARQRDAASRGLTIRRRSDAAPNDDLDADIMVDGPIRYGDIRSFDPDPYVDSGLQYPFGLDGIGGFGSDLGFTAAADAAVYARGR